jgi:hypothetical protein
VSVLKLPSFLKEVELIFVRFSSDARSISLLEFGDFCAYYIFVMDTTYRCVFDWGNKGAASGWITVRVRESLLLARTVSILYWPEVLLRSLIIRGS